MALTRGISRQHFLARQASSDSKLGNRSSGFSLAGLRAKHGRSVALGAVTAVIAALFTIPALTAAAAGDGSGNADLGVDKHWTGQYYGSGQWAVPDPPFTTLDPTQNTLSAIINVTNQGPDSTTRVVVTDPIPPGWTITEASYQGQGGDGSTGPVNGNQCQIFQAGQTMPNGATAASPNGEVYCEVYAVGPWDPNVPIQPGFTAQIQLVGQVNPTDCNTRTITNTAFINTGSTSDPNLANQSSNAGTVSKAGCQADLEMDKTPATQQVSPGSNATFTLTAKNWGPAAADNTVITDTLPAGLTPATPLPSGCSASGQVVTCNVGTIPAPPTEGWPPVVVNPTEASVTIQAVVSANVTGPVTNSATVGSTTPDPNPDNNTDTAIVTPTPPQADVQLVKTGPANVLANGQITYHITVTNNGPSTATNVVVTDIFPPELSNPTIATSVGSCTSAGVCQLGSMPNGASAVITVTGNAPASGTLVNTANVTTDTPGDDPNNNEDSVTTVVTPATPPPPAADVQVEKTPASQDVVPGQTATWDLVATNNGPDTAANTVLTDVIPAGMTVTLITPLDACQLAGQIVTCNFGDLPAGGTQSVHIVAQLDPDYTGTDPLTNRGHVTTSTNDTNPNNNNDTAIVNPLPPVANVVVAKTGDSQVTAGNHISWQVVVTNNGPSTAKSVTVTDQLPDGILDGSVTATVAGQPCTVAGSTITCPVGDMASGQQTPISIQGTVDPDQPAGTITNTATATTPTTPSIPPATWPTDVANEVDVAIVKQVMTSNPVSSGQVVDWALTVTNYGPSAAQDVVISDKIDPALAAINNPVRLTYEGYVTYCPVDVASGTFTCPPIRMEPGEVDVAKISINTTLASDLPAQTQIVNTGTVTAPNDTNPNNNTSTAQVATAGADLNVTKTATPDNAKPGDSVTWTITMENLGPNPAIGPVLTDTFADASQVTGLAVTNVQSSDGPSTMPSCGTVANGTVTCSATSLSVGGVITVMLSGTMAAGLTDGTLVNNTAIGSSNTADSNPNNNTDNSTVTINVPPTPPSPQANLNVSKIANPTVAKPGAPVTWTVVLTNNGPDTATSPVLTDTFADASQVTNITVASITSSDTGNNPSCSAVAGGVVRCTANTLSSGGTITLTMTGNLADDVAPNSQVADTAIGSSQTPGTPGEDNAVVDVIPPEANYSVTKTASPNPAEPGDTVTWTIVMTNNGPDPSVNPVLTDTLAHAGQVNNVTVTSVTSSDEGNNPACGDVTAGTVRCTADSLSVGGTVTLVLTGTIADDIAPGSQVANTATGHSETPGSPGDGNGNINIVVPPIILPPTPIPPEANLSVTKTASPTTADPGDEVTWTMVLLNHGPTTAEGVTLLDEFSNPNQVTDVSVINAVSSDDGNNLVCTAPQVSPSRFHETVTKVVNNLLDDQEVCQWDETLSADAAECVEPDAEPEVCLSDESLAADSEDCRIEPEVCQWDETLLADAAECVDPDAEPEVCLSDESLFAGGADCVDPADAADTDGAPPACEWDDTLLADDAACVEPVTECPAGSSANAEGTCIPDSIETGLFQFDSPLIFTPVRYLPTLAVMRTALLQFVDDGLETAAAHPAGPVTCTADSLSVGGTITVTLRGTIDSAVTDGEEVVNHATGSSNTPGNPGDGEATVNVPAVPAQPAPDASLTLHKHAYPAPPAQVMPGDQVTWQVVLINTGPGTAINPVLTDTLADPTQVTGVTVTSATSSDGAAAQPQCAGEATITCTAPSLSVGGSITVTLTGTVSDTVENGDQITNTASAAADNATPPQDVPAVVDVVVPTPPALEANLVLTKSANPAVAQQGDQVTWTVEMRNVGPDTATNPTFTDTFAHAAQVTGFAIQSVVSSDDGNNPSCEIVAVGSATCRASTLAPLGTITATFTGTIAESVADGSTILNVVVGSSDTPGNPGRGQAVVEVPNQLLEANLKIVKTPSVTEVQPGGTVTWIVVMTNNGPDTAVSPTLTDTFGHAGQISGLQVTGVTSSDSGTNPRCGAIAGGVTVTCTASSLSKGGTITVTLTATIPASLPVGVQVLNIATGSSNTPGMPGEGGAIVRVVQPPTPPTPPAPEQTPPVPATPPQLQATGASTALLLVVAVAILSAGVVLITKARKHEPDAQ